MERQKNFEQEYFMFPLQRQRESVDNRTQNFQKLCNTIVSLRFVDEAVENVVDLFTNESSKVEELAINSDTS